MTIAVGVHTVAAVNFASSTTTSAITTQASGSRILVAAFGKKSSPTITDSKSNTWSLLGTQAFNGTFGFSSIYECVNATGGSGHTFTATQSSGDNLSIMVVELTGTPTTGASTLASADQGSGTTQTFPTVTTTQANQYILSFLGGGSVTTDNGSGFAFIDTNTSFLGCASSSAAATTAGTYGDNMTVAVSSDCALHTVAIPATSAAGAVLAGVGTSIGTAVAAFVTGIALVAGAICGAQCSGDLTTSTATGLSLGVSTAAHANATTTSITTIPVTTHNNSGFVVALLDRGGSAGVVTDNKGNTYTQIDAAQVFHFTSMTATLWYCPKGVGGAGHSVTGTQGYNSDMAIFFQEIISNTGLGVTLDQEVAGVASSSPFNSSAISTTLPQEVLLAFFGGFSQSNPATLVVTSGTLQLRATIVDGSASNEACGGMAASVVSSLQSGLTTAMTQAGNTGSAALFLASFYATPVPGLVAGNAVGIGAASGFLQTAAKLVAPSSSQSTAVAALTQWASVTLVAQGQYTGIGGIYDPYFWEDAVPKVGDTVYYDPQYMLIYQTGEIYITQNNISAAVQFNNGTGFAFGLIQFTISEVGYAYGQASASGALTTIPSVFGGFSIAAGACSGVLTTSFKLAGDAKGLASAGPTDAITAVQLNGVSVSLCTVGATVLGSNPVMTSIATSLAASTGALQLRQAFSSPAKGLATATGNLTNNPLFAAGSGLATATGNLTTSFQLRGAAVSLSTANGLPSMRIQLIGTAAGIATGSLSLSTRIQIIGNAASLGSAVGLLGVGAGLKGSAFGIATVSGLVGIGASLKGTAVATITNTGALTAKIAFKGDARGICYADPGIVNLITGQSPIGMYQEDPRFMIGQHFPDTPTFVVLGPTEKKVFTFDFGDDLVNGETLTGVALPTVENTAGNDPMILSILDGLASFDPTQTMVMVPINAAHGLIDNDYYITVSCPTTNPQKALDRFCLLQIRS